MSKARLYIFAIIVALVALIGLIWYFAASSSPQSGTKLVTLPGLNGQKVKTKDFVAESQVFGNVALLYSDSDFTIQFDRNQNNFSIAFSGTVKESIIATRLKAENILVTKLELSKQEVCNLSVGEIIVRYEDLGIKQQVFAPSFCPGGDLFPK